MSLLLVVVFGDTLQDHGEKKGDDLLASVRLLGRCFALFFISYTNFVPFDSETLSDVDI